MWIIEIKKKHISLSIEIIEKYINKQKDKNWFCIKSFGMNYEYVKMTFLKMKGKWKKYIPLEKCKNINSDWSCWC